MPARSMRFSALSLPLALVVVAALVPAPAHAQGAHTGGGSHTGGGITVPPRDTFSEDYTEASRAWHEGRYEDALSRFRALHRSSGRDELLYDIGITADRLGRLDEAIEALQQYLARVPQAHNRAEVEQRIASLRDDLREDSATVAPEARTTSLRAERPVMTLQGLPPTASAPPPPRDAIAQPPPQRAEPPEEIVIGGGPEWIATWPLLVLTIGTAIAAPVAWDQGSQALTRFEAYCRPLGGCDEDQIASSDVKNWELATNVLLVSSLVLGATTLIVFLVEGLSGSRTTVVRRAQRDRVDLRVGLGAAGLEGWF